MGYTLRQLTGYSTALDRIESARLLRDACAARAAQQDGKGWREWTKQLERAIDGR
jgi:hypothetical protein